VALLRSRRRSILEATVPPVATVGHCCGCIKAAYGPWFDSCRYFRYQNGRGTWVGHRVRGLRSALHRTGPIEEPRAVDTPLVVDTPNDPEFLKQFARASMLHAHLDNALKMFVRSFDGTTIGQRLSPDLRSRQRQASCIGCDLSAEACAESGSGLVSAHGLGPAGTLLHRDMTDHFRPDTVSHPPSRPGASPVKIFWHLPRPVEISAD
jgi:hypothetical protein